MSEHCLCYSKGGRCCACGRTWDENHPVAAFWMGLGSFIAVIAFLWFLLRLFGA